MTTVETAWLAGLFEGEGSLTTAPHHVGCQLRIKMTDKDVIDKIQSIAGGTKGPVKTYQAHHKQAWEWRLSSRNYVYPLLVKLLPFMGERRALKFLNQLDRYDNCYSIPAA